MTGFQPKTIKEAIHQCGGKPLKKAELFVKCTCGQIIKMGEVPSIDSKTPINIHVVLGTDLVVDCNRCKRQTIIFRKDSDEV